MNRPVLMFVTALLCVLPLQAQTPQSADDYFKLGNLHFDKREFSAAIAAYDTAIQMSPALVSAYFNRGLARIRTRKWKEAATDFSKVIELDPSNSRAYYNRGVSRQLTHDNQGAIGDFSKAIELDPKFSDSYYQRGLLRSQASDHAGALSDYAKAIEADPANTDAYLARAHKLEKEGELERALADFAKVVELAPKSTYGYINRSRVNLLLGRGELAHQDAVAYLKLEIGKGKTANADVILFGYFGLRHAHKDAEAQAFLDEWMKLTDAGDWRYPILKYLHRDLNEAQLLSTLKDPFHVETARVYLGLDLLYAGQHKAAMDHFNWVRDHSESFGYFPEHRLALAEIKRLEAASKPKP